MDTKKAHDLISSIELSRGRGASFEENLRVVWETLCRAAGDTDTIPRKVFELSLSRLRRYIVALEDKGAVRLALEGRTIVRIDILKRFESPKENAASTASTCRIIRGGRFLDESPEAPPDEQQERVPKPKPHEPVHPTQQKIEETPSVIMYVDVPNLTGFDSKVKNSRYIDPRRANWKALKEIARLWKGSSLKIERAFAYIKSAKDDKFDFSFMGLQNAGFEVVRNENGKDIDPLMIVDIMDPAILELERRRRLVLVVISGDGDFAPALRRVKERARVMNVPLHVHVISWTYVKNGASILSHALQCAADEVTTIEDHLDRIDSVGSKQYERNHPRRKKPVVAHRASKLARYSRF